MNNSGAAAAANPRAGKGLPERRAKAARGRRPCAAGFAAVALVLAGAGGCHYSKVSLAGDSLSDRPGELWPGEPQYVHVGETVRFDFRVRPNLDNYAIFQFPDKEVLLLADRAIEGYRTRYTFLKETSPREIQVKATGYRVRGYQDLMQINDRLIGLQTPNDPPDEAMGSDTLRVIVYQSSVTFPVPKEGDAEPDWSKTFIRIIANDVKRISKDLPKLEHGSAQGYRVSSPDATGAYRVYYQPTVDQVNRGGTTLAELHLSYSDGWRTILGKEFDTP